MKNLLEPKKRKRLNEKCSVHDWETKKRELTLVTFKKRRKSPETQGKKGDIKSLVKTVTLFKSSRTLFWKKKKGAEDGAKKKGGAASNRHTRAEKKKKGKRKSGKGGVVSN